MPSADTVLFYDEVIAKTRRGVVAGQRDIVGTRWLFISKEAECGDGMLDTAAECDE